jgi:hypothetical protein
MYQRVPPTVVSIPSMSSNSKTRDSPKSAITGLKDSSRRTKFG